MDIIERSGRRPRRWPYGIGVLFVCVVAVGAWFALRDTQADRVRAARSDIVHAGLPSGAKALSSCTPGSRCFVLREPRDPALDATRRWLQSLGFTMGSRDCLKEQPPTESCVVQGRRDDVKVTALSDSSAAESGSTRIVVVVFAGTSLP